VRVSVVLPVRNGATHFAETLASVLAQTVPAHEILVVDGGSTDATREIAAAFPGVRLLDQRGPNLSSAYNTALAELTGDLVAFQSHDDLWSPAKTERQIEHLRARPGLDFSLVSTEVFVGAGDSAPPGARLEALGGPRRVRVLEAMLLRRSIVDRNGPFREELAPLADTEWIARLATLGARSEYLDDCLLRKRLHSGSTQHAAGPGRLLRNLKAAIDGRRRGGRN
jgi:glycosyltransferase involved in cell wall biosynthesis